MMKMITILFFILMGSNSFAKDKKSVVEKKKVTEIKTYQVEKNSPQILIGEDSSDSKPIVAEVARLPDYWHTEVLLTNLTFHLPALSGGAPSFTQSLVGVNVGRALDNKILGRKGNFEFGGQFQQYERSTKIGPRGDFSQKINVFQLSIYQNFNFVRAFEDSIFITAGLGLAPMYLISEQSIYTNSLSELGFQVMGKANFIFPIRQVFSWRPKHLAANVELLAGVGKIADHTMSTLSLGLGANFE